MMKTLKKLKPKSKMSDGGANRRAAPSSPSEVGIGYSSYGSGLETLPSSLLIGDIFLRLDLESLCSLSCVSTAFLSHADQALLLLPPTLDLSAFSSDARTLRRIVARRRKGPESITLNCLRLEDSHVVDLLGPQVQELNLLSGSLFSFQLLASIGDRCPNLRILVVELTDRGSVGVFNRNLNRMLSKCLHLESLCLKVRWTEHGAHFFHSVEVFLPKSMRTLKLNPMLREDALHLVSRLRVDRSFMGKTNCSLSPMWSHLGLQCLSLVVDFLSDELIVTITNTLPFLVELDLEDRPKREPSLHQDVSNMGLQSLCACHHLTTLSLIRSRHNHPASFKRINDMGIFLLSEGCRGLESLRMSGLSKVTDAGFSTILHSCKNLKKFEVRNAMLMSDLAFHDLIEAPCSLVEVRLLSCSLITSETVKKLACSRTLEVLDFSGSRSIANSCLDPVSHLSKLTSLNLAGADVTDDGLFYLGQGSPPITHLYLRGCKRVTDKGIIFLLNNEATIRKTLSTLDLGHLPGISDKAILAISVACIEISELCIRSCFYVTDISIHALATKSVREGGSKGIQKLDLYKCTGLSDSSVFLRNEPLLFRGLRWLGIGQTRLSINENGGVEGYHRGREWMTVCLDGCEMGCHDGWQFHISEHIS